MIRSQVEEKNLTKLLKIQRDNFSFEPLYMSNVNPAWSSTSRMLTFFPHIHQNKLVKKIR
jgi:hypothetical protein